VVAISYALAPRYRAAVERASWRADFVSPHVLGSLAPMCPGAGETLPPVTSRATKTLRSELAVVCVTIGALLRDLPLPAAGPDRDARHWHVVATTPPPSPLISSQAFGANSAAQSATFPFL